MINKDTNASDALLNDLLAVPLEIVARPMADFNTWRKTWEEAGRRWDRPIHRSIFAGLLCDRLAWAFASGYQEAIRHLYPDLPDGVVVAMCISESGGNHPKSIRTRLTPTRHGFRIDGEKQFITGGEHADRLIVAASTGMEGGRNRLRMVRVDRDAPGVMLNPMPPLPVIPEIGHSSAHLHDVRIPPAHMLPGDGYDQAVKPFRTIEDLHVTGAVLGHLLGVARRSGWPVGIVARLSCLIVATAALAGGDPLSPATHLAMGGLLEQIDALLAAVDPLWPEADSDIARRWQRDKPVLTIADKIRRLRLETARRRYGL
jgi:hypothetical protein